MSKKSLAMHEKHQGKWQTSSKVKLNSQENLSLYYTPGVADPCMEIFDDSSKINKYTNYQNTIAVISDGSAVLGLGDIGPKASLPVMEGKAIIFKEFANVDAVPILLDTKDPNKIVETIVNIAPSFAGINLEDISAPRCFEIEKKLIEKLDIPIFHDDQHGTAIVVSAAIINAAKLTNKKISDLKVIITGLGAAGVAISKMIRNLGVKVIHAYDKNGFVTNKRKEHFVQELIKDKIIDPFNQDDSKLIDGFKGKDIFIGVSAPNLVNEDMIKNMNQNPWVFSLANPTPEISYHKAIDAGALIVGTGRSDNPNQINNILAFPGIFKGVLKYGIAKISDNIKIAVAKAIANTILDDKLNNKNILPSPFDKNVVLNIVESIKNFQGRNNE